MFSTLLKKGKGEGREGGKRGEGEGEGQVMDSSVLNTSISEYLNGGCRYQGEKIIVKVEINE